jgi:hypothetical protein
MKNRKLLVSWLFVFLFLATFAITGIPYAMAQTASTGALTGTITDPSGAVVANAQIVITNRATGQSRTATSGINGSYRFTLLPPGTYSVSVSMTGFKTAEFPSVTINVTETAALNCRLEIGVQSETFIVEAGTEALQTTSSTLGTLVDSEEVVTLPLTSRNYTQILDLSAGVSASVNNATVMGKGTQYTSVNGSNPSQNNYQMDGVAINSMALLGSSADQNVGAGIGIPSPDAIQEFKVQTSNYDASFGRNPGGNVNVITKSGTNDFHGTAFYFLRNTALNANPFFYNRDNPESATKKPVLNQNQFGFVVGGPIKKDRFFIFGSYQGTRQKNGIAGQGQASIRLPPIPEGDRTAPDFPAKLGAAFCGYQPFFPFLENVACDGSNINPVALKILQLKTDSGSYYVPGSGTTDFKQVAFSDPARMSGNQFIINSDFIINPKHTLSTRYFYTRDPQDITLGGQLPGNPKRNFYSNHDAVLKLTSFVSNTFTNEFRGSYQRNWGELTDTPVPGSSPQELGMKPMVPDMDLPPQLNIFLDGISLFNSFNPANSLAGHFQLADQIAWARNDHMIRAGFEWERVQYYSNPGFTRGYILIGRFNDFLVGKPGNLFMCIACVKGTGPMGTVVHGYRMNNLNAFIQDDWKVSPNLTLNIGLRWEFFGAFSDKYGNLTNMWPSRLATVPVPPTGPTTSGDGLVGFVVPKNHSDDFGPPPAGVLQVDNYNSLSSHPPYTNFAPRIGVAWRPMKSSKFVVRAGFGLFYDRVWADAFVHGFQEGSPYAGRGDYGPFNPQTLQEPFREFEVGAWQSRWSNLTCDPDGTNCTGATSNLTIPFLEARFRTPLTRQYNVNVQYEFAPRWVLEVAYVGMTGIHLMNIYHNVNTARLASQDNPINGQIANTLANVNLRVPYLGFQPEGLQGTQFNGSSNYNAFQVTLSKQFSYGLSLQGAYTWSKNLSDLQTYLGSYYNQNSNDADDPRQQYGRTSFNRPQRFILNYQYDLPLGTYQGFAGVLLNNWKVAGITTFQSGTPLTFTDSSAGSIYGTQTSARAQMSPDATHASILTSGDVRDRLGGNSGGPGYINADAFTAPPTGGIYGDGTGFGNSSKGVVLGPGQANWDFILIKDTKLTETQTLQFRTEFYNAFNTPQFANPNTAIGPTLGEITATSVNPRIIQFGLKYIF